MRRSTFRKILAYRDVCGDIGMVDAQTRKELASQARRKAWCRPAAWGFFGVLIALAVTMWYFQFVRTPPLVSPDTFNLLFSSGLVIATLVFEYDSFRYARLWLADELHRRGIRPRVCFRCDRWLREVSSKYCPECGQPLAPPRASHDNSEPHLASEPRP